MKNFKRILAAVCILAVLCAGVIITVIAEAETGYTGDVAQAQVLLDAVNAAEGTEAKRTAMNELDAYMADNTFNADEEDYIAFTAAYAAAEKALRIDEVVELAEAARASGQAADWDAVLEQLQAKPVANEDLPAEILADIDTHKFARANELLDAVGLGINGNTAVNRTKINPLNAFLKNNPLNEEHADYAAFKKAYDAKIEEHNNQVKANFEALEANAIISDYALLQNMLWDMETPETSPINSYNPTEDGSRGQVIYNGSYTTKVGSATEENGNGYYYFDYTEYSDGGTYIYMSPTLCQNMVPDSTSGLVVELDFTYFDELSSGGFEISGSEQSKTHFKDDGTPLRPGWTFLKIDKNGTLKCGIGSDSYQDSEGVSQKPVYASLENAVTKGEWTHITAVYHPKNYTVDIYVDYALVGTAPIVTHEVSVQQFDITFPRFGATAKTGGFALDNVAMYQGTSIRTLDKLQNMSDEQLLDYYTEYASTEGRDITSRVLAYNRAGELISNNYLGNPDGIFGNEDDVWTLDGLDTDVAEEVKACVTAYYALDMEAVVDEYKAQNLQSYMDKVASVKKIARKPNNSNERLLAVEEIKTFLEEIGDYIDTESADYIKASADLALIEKEIEADENINDFVLYMKRFNNALDASLAAMNRHYNSAKEIYGLFDESAFEVLNDDFPSKDLYAEFAQALDDYAAATDKIAEKIRENNSQKIIDCVDFIRPFSTQSDWDENYAFIERYVLIVRETLREGNYVADYEGLDEALAVYNRINVYFYNNLQESHIAEISRCLDEYLASDSYIARVGLIYYIERYVAFNDIDPENEELQSLILTFKTYQGELDIQEENYDKILNQNTVFFVNYVEELKTCVDYASMKEVYEQAKVYYYSMNVASPEVQDAILTFDEYTAILEVAEEATAMFCGYAAQLEGAQESEIYTILAYCCKYVDDVEVTISDDAAAAYSAFEAAYEDYMKDVNDANDDLEEIFVAVGSTSANSGVAPIISIILGIIA